MAITVMQNWLMGSGKQTIDLARLHFRNRGVGRVVRQIHALTNQRYTGDVTILLLQEALGFEMMMLCGT